MKINKLGWFSVLGLAVILLLAPMAEAQFGFTYVTTFWGGSCGSNCVEQVNVFVDPFGYECGEFYFDYFYPWGQENIYQGPSGDCPWLG